MTHEKQRLPIVTGSRVYGTPTEDSDLDIVVRCDEYVIAAIEAIVGRYSCDYDHKSLSVRAGPLNLHLCSTDQEYDRWEQGTKTCVVVAPVDRPTAKKLMKVAGVDRGGETETSEYSSTRKGPGKVTILREDGTLAPYREWMGWGSLG